MFSKLNNNQLSDHSVHKFVLKHTFLLHLQLQLSAYGIQCRLNGLGDWSDNLLLLTSLNIFVHLTKSSLVTLLINTKNQLVLEAPEGTGDHFVVILSVYRSGHSKVAPETSLKRRAVWEFFAKTYGENILMVPLYMARVNGVLSTPKSNFFAHKLHKIWF